MYVASVSAGVRRESWEKMHELSGRGGVFSFPFPSVFFLTLAFSQHKLDRKHLLHMHRVSSDQEATTYNKRGNRTDMQYLPILNLGRKNFVGW